MISVPVPVKEALKNGRLKKNYRFIVLNNDDTEDFTIDNDNLVAESVNIDERMCSGDTIKFGLCEGTSLEFQYFGVENITGRRLQALIDIQLDSPLWTKKANLSGTDYISYTIIESNIYGVTIPANQTTPLAIYWYHDGQYIGDNVGISNVDQVVLLGELFAGDVVHISTAYLNYPFTATLNTGTYWYSIPLGFFDVKKCSRQASTGIIKATCYNKLQSEYLDAKANDLILEAVEEGEVGITGSATIDTILMRLLDDYTIEPKFNKANYIVGTNWSIASGSYFFNTPNGYHIYAPAGYIEVDISHIDPNGAYRFWIDRTKFKERLLNAMGSYAGIYVRDTNHPSDEYYPLYDVVTKAMGHDITPPYINILMESGYQVAASCNPAIGDGEYVSDYVIKKYTQDKVYIRIPMTYIYESSGYTPDATVVWNQLSQSERENIIQLWTNYFNDPTAFRIELRDSNGLGSIEFTTEYAETLPDVTLRELQSAVYEVSCQFGRLSRTTDLFEGVELNHSRLYPATTLYPATNLYPDGAVLSANKSMYSQLWADEGNVHKWRYLIITYKTINIDTNEEEETILQRTVNADGTDDYNMSDNWLFRNLLWSASDVGTYADAMVAKMQDITWFPFEMWLPGLPYLETGDEIEIPVGENSYTSYILQRQLKGIQNLQDTYINGTLDIF